MASRGFTAEGVVEHRHPPICIPMPPSPGVVLASALLDASLLGGGAEASITGRAASSEGTPVSSTGTPVSTTTPVSVITPESRGATPESVATPESITIELVTVTVNVVVFH